MTMQSEKTKTSSTYRVIEISRGADRYLVGVHIKQRVWRSPPLASGEFKVKAYGLAGGIVGLDRPPILLGSMGGSFSTLTEGCHFRLTGGTMCLIPRARSLGIGTYLMNEVVRWATSQDLSGTVSPISLAARDAETEAERDRRNRFYEQFGFVLDNLRTVNGIDRAEGRSKEGQKLGEFMPLAHVRGVTIYETDNAFAMICTRLQDAEWDRDRAKEAMNNAQLSKERIQADLHTKLKTANRLASAVIVFALALVFICGGARRLWPVWLAALVD